MNRKPASRRSAGPPVDGDAAPQPAERIVRVLATPDARREAVLAMGTDRYQISVKEKAEQGRANARIRELLAATLEVPPERLTLIAGAHRPAKRYRVLPPARRSRG